MPLRIRTKLFSIIAGFLLVVFLSTYLIFIFIYRRNMNDIILKGIHYAEYEWHMHEQMDINKMSSNLEVFLKNQDFKDVFLSRDRERLFEYGQPLFKEFKDKYGITHFYFHTPDGRNFVRLHDRDDYGDVIERATLKMVQSSGQFASGLELGKTAFALRVVAPWSVNGGIIGYVELAQEIGHFIDHIKGETRNEFAIIARKEYLSRENWSSVRKEAGLPDNWDESGKYLWISRSLERPGTKECFTERNLEAFERRASFLQDFPSEGFGLACGGFPINDAAGNHVGVVLSMIDISEQTAFMNKAKLYVAPIFVALSVLVFLPTGLLVRHSIAGPIEVLQKRADAIARGEFKARVEVASRDELGQLANAMNEMAEQLDTFTSNLHGMVEERTRELKESEERYRLLIESSPNPVGVHREGKLIYVNNAGARIMGAKDPQELIGMPVTKILHKDYHEIVKERHRRALEEGTNAPPMEEKFVRLDNGEEVTVEITVVPMMYEGKPSLLSVGHDITERKKAEEELRYERDKLIRVFEAMEDGVYIVNQNYDIEYINPVLEKEFGPWKGIKCYTYLHDRTEVCPWCPNQRVFAGETVRWEWTSLKNGKTYDLIDTPLRQPDGSIWKLEIFRDITEKKKTEEALYKSEELLKLQIRRMPVGYIVWDSSFRVVSWNPTAERIFGFTLEEAKGKHPYDLIVPKEAQPHVDIVWHRLLKGDITAHSINENLTKDGRTIICEWVNTPLRYHNGDVIGALSMVQDITERKKADEALKESETRYKGLIESVTDYIFTVEVKDGRPVKTTHGPGCVAITGYTSEEYERNPDLWLQMVYEGDREAVIRQAESVLSGKAEPIEHRIICREGRIKWVRNVPVPRYDEQGRLIAYDGLISNITERKEAEDELRETRNYLENLFNYANAPIIVWNPAFRITRFNHAFEHFTGYKADEVIGKELGLLFPEASREDSMDKIIRTSVGEFWESVEIPIIRKDGDIRIALWNSANINAEDGKTLMATIAQGQDFTERKKAEQELARHVDELERYMKATVQREFRIKELRDRVEELEKRLKG